MKTCPYCNGPMKMRYPGNDPENGPAYPQCARALCVRAASAVAEAMRYAMTDGTTLDELHEEALEEEAMDQELAALYPATLEHECYCELIPSGEPCEVCVARSRS